MEVPSRVESGASQCDWSDTDLTCTMRPPPSDPIFTILVSLLTVLISIPVTMGLTVVLEEFCSKYPGRRLHDDDFVIDRKESILTSESESSQMLRNATTEFAFGDVIRKGIWRGSPSNVISSSDNSKVTYNGQSV